MEAANDPNRRFQYQWLGPRPQDERWKHPTDSSLGRGFYGFIGMGHINQGIHQPALRDLIGATLPIDKRHSFNGWPEPPFDAPRRNLIAIDLEVHVTDTPGITTTGHFGTIPHDRNRDTPITGQEAWNALYHDGGADGYVAH